MMTRIHVLPTLLAFILGCPPSPANPPTSSPDASVAAPDSTVVSTTTGTLRGVLQDTSLVFKGIPYAMPPVDAHRWRAPRAAAAWEGIRDAADFGPTCMQSLLTGGGLEGSEDCLTLNVWTPAERGTPLPVLVWIHGGANIVGAGSEASYDGRQLAERGAVVVTLNYRLGAFGFLAHPALAQDGVTGNYALLDQILALQWVRDNVAAFGGDAGKVLIFGQSSGADNVCALLASPKARGLFGAAMMMSAGCGPASAEEAEQTWKMVQHSLHCDEAQDVAGCLHAASAASVATLDGASLEGGIGGGSFYYSVNGDTLLQAPLDAFAAGEASNVPVVITTAMDEFSTLLDVALGFHVETETEVIAVLDALVGQEGRALILQQYPLASYGSPREAVIHILGDASYHCPSRRAVRALAQHQRVYQGVFAYIYPDALSFGAGHGLDTGFYFGVHDAPVDDAGEALTHAMASMVIRLAGAGDPNGNGLPTWPVSGEEEVHMQFDRTITTGARWKDAACNFWDAASGSP